MLINFTLVDLRGQKLDAASTWKSAVRRYLSKANSLLFKLNLQNTQEETGRRLRNREKEAKHYHPLGDLKGDAIAWRDDFNALVSTLGLGAS